MQCLMYIQCLPTCRNYSLCGFGFTYAGFTAGVPPADRKITGCLFQRVQDVASGQTKNDQRIRIYEIRKDIPSCNNLSEPLGIFTE